MAEKDDAQRMTSHDILATARAKINEGIKSGSAAPLREADALIAEVMSGRFRKNDPIETEAVDADGGDDDAKKRSRKKSTKVG